MQKARALAVFGKKFKAFFFFQHAPKNRLLVFKSQDGWKPLCEFLGKEIPQQSYPWRNKGGHDVINMVEQHSYATHVKKEFLTIISVALLVFALLLYWLLHLCF